MAVQGEEKMQEIQVTCESEYPDYVYNAKEDASVVVTLTAPVIEEDKSEETRPPIDLVAVIDKSGSMAGEKLKLVKKTLEFIIAQLNAKDRLGLVTYDTGVYVDFGLRLMNKDNKQDSLVKVQNLTDGSCTNLCGGLLAGLSQIIDRPNGGKNDVASVLLLTDGLANEGITSAHGIIAAMKDVKVHAPVVSQPAPPSIQRSSVQQPQPKLGFFQKLQQQRNPPPPPATPVEAVAVSQSASAGKVADASVYTFGFGSDHDPNLLKAISDAGNGMYYFIERDDQIAEAFGHCLGGLQSTVAQGIQMEVAFEHGVSLSKLHSSRPSQHLNPQTLKIDVGDLQSEETRDLVMELHLDPVAAPYTDTPQHIFSVKVHYYNVAKTEMQIAAGKLTVLRPEHTERKKDDVNLNVRKQFARVNLAEALRTSKLAADKGDLKEANICIQAYKSSMLEEQAMFADRGLEYNAMLDDIGCAGDLYADEETYRSKGQHAVSNMMQMHNVQRAAACGVSSSVAYETKGKMKKKAEGRKFLSK